MNSILTLLQQRYTTKSWTTEPVTDAELTQILQAAHIAPSKMALAQHHIVALTDSHQGKAIKDWLFWQHTWAQDGYPAYAVPHNHVSKTPRDYNGQYRAPVVLFWVMQLKPSERIKMPESENYEVHTPDEHQQRADAYISSTCALLQALQLGLHTGYGVCHHTQTVSTRLGYPNSHAVVALGVGHAADTQHLEQDCVIPVIDAQGDTLGNMVANISQDSPDHFNRSWRPSYEQMIKII